jgi:single-stranded DNA-binding protein
MTTLFLNSVKMRGFLGREVELHDAEPLTRDSYAVLTLCIESGIWKKATNEWTPRTEWHRIVCPGPYFCGFTKDMKQGDYIEIEGQLHVSYYNRPVIIEGERMTAKRPVYEVLAFGVRRLETPLIGVDEGEDG